MQGAEERGAQRTPLYVSTAATKATPQMRPYRRIWDTPVAVDASLIDLAVALTRRQKLRGCDAIQLASALTLNTSLTSQALLPLTFVAADADLLAAAAAEGLAIDNPNSHL